MWFQDAKFESEKKEEEEEKSRPSADAIENM